MMNRIDHSKIPEGYCIFKDNLLDPSGNIVGPVPRKQFESNEEYEDYLKNISTKIPQPIAWNEFDKEIFPEQKWWIKHLIPYEGFVIIAAPSGERKTWLAMHMAGCITNGLNFANSEHFPSQLGNVLYIDQEMPKRLSQERGRLLGLNSTKYKLWHLNQDALNLKNEETIQWLLKFIEDNNINVIFIDTFRAVAGGIKEEKAEEIRQFFNQYLHLKNKGVCMVFLDHCRKPYQNEPKIPKKEQLFASQDKVASIEVLIMIRSENQSDEIKVYIEKNRCEKEFEPFKITMKDVLDNAVSEVKVKSISMEYAGPLEDEKVYKIEIAKDAILEFLQTNGGGALQKEIVKAVKNREIGKRNIEDAIRALRRSKIIYTHKVDDGNYCYLPTKEDAEEIEET